VERAVSALSEYGAEAPWERGERSAVETQLIGKCCDCCLFVCLFVCCLVLLAVGCY